MRTLVNKKDDKTGKVVGRTPEEMKALWNERVESLKALDGESESDDDDDDGDDDDDDKSKPAKKKTYTVSVAVYKAVLKALRANKSPQIATDACRFLVGEIEKVRGLSVEVPE